MLAQNESVMQNPDTCLPAHELRPLTADDMRGAVPEEYLIIGALICPQCGLIYSRAFAERYGETPQAA